MKRPLLVALVLCLSLTGAGAAMAMDKVLLVVSGFGLDGGRTRPGYEFDELSQAYLVLRDNGYEVEIASPNGGAVVADDYDVEKPYNALFLADTAAVSMLAATRPIRELDPEAYVAIFVIGGKGAMFDLPYDPVLKDLLLKHYTGGGVLAAVCHGPAAFVRLRTGEGQAVIAGAPMAGFTNEEEYLFGAKWLPHFPFLLEEELIAQGARFTEAEPMMPFVQSGNRIVTGQNPSSTALAAEALVRALGREPVARELWADERSLLLVQRFMAGETEWAAGELAARPGHYDMPLIAMYGYYRAKDETAEADDLRHGLSIMELAAPYFDHPQLREAIAATRLRVPG
ncbi:MAG: type 1 glutamine amidotransferase domain-containing protein [Pseudomonadota bacterium]|nr:type 1 glutamine amidotransferase domain-containing protein [Pseudomonadota bacterium]